MAEMSVRYQTSVLAGIKARVGAILETQYKMDINTREKIVSSYFGDGQLPHWYFYSNSPEDIARHLFIVTRLLNANTGQIPHVSDDSRVITYLINVGRDFPGRLERIIEQNASMRIASFDSESTMNGVRIVSLERLTEDPPAATPELAAAMESLKEDLRYYGNNRDLAHVDRFVESLSLRYLQEELQSTQEPRRAERHLVFYDRLVDTKGPLVDLSEVRYEDDTGREARSLRVTAGINAPGETFIPALLRVFERRGINLVRTYYDLFRHRSGNVGILSAYFDAKAPVEGLVEELLALKGLSATGSDSRAELERRIEGILRRLARTADPAASDAALTELKALCSANGPGGTGAESGSFYLNSVTDFMAAAAVSGVDACPRALRLLLGYDAFDEFFVSASSNGRIENVPGYRIKHSSVRGPAKGGLRIDPIVSFDEVAALSFMMTWKCARSRILFGGAKGGLMLDSRSFEGTAIDFFDTLSSFGRSLFLVSGPMRDVPAGDVGCGPKEIGHMFEGFKSALRDLATMAYGLKPGVTMIGGRIVSLEEARRMLAEHFDVDWTNPAMLRELTSSETYLELVAAAQITGKPKHGIAARGAATGLGMAYAVLAAVGRLYLEGRWTSARTLSTEETALLEKAAAVDEAAILREERDDAYGSGGADADPRGRASSTAEGTDGAALSGRLLTDAEWRVLSEDVYPALLSGKTLAVQGSGKVGGALMDSLAPYGVNLVAVCDAGGAVFGDRLDPAEIRAAVEGSRNHPDRALRASVIHLEKNVRERVLGAAEGGRRLLELECDILAPAALENAVTEENAPRVRAKLEVCGANGPNSSRAERILWDKGVTVIYDFLANGAGVTASYFEWLRNLSDRFRYEAERIRGEPFDPGRLTPYAMPEFRRRIVAILSVPESDATTAAWNLLLRDIMFAAVNDDWNFSRKRKVSLRTAGFVNAQLRVLAAYLARMDEHKAEELSGALPQRTRDLLGPFLEHPEARLLKNRSAAGA